MAAARRKCQENDQNWMNLPIWDVMEFVSMFYIAILIKHGVINDPGFRTFPHCNASEKTWIKLWHDHTSNLCRKQHTLLSQCTFKLFAIGDVTYVMTESWDKYMWCSTGKIRHDINITWNLCCSTNCSGTFMYSCQNCLIVHIVVRF